MASPLEDYSDLQLSRLAYVAPVPFVLAGVPSVVLSETTSAPQPADAAALRSWFPRTYGLPMASLEAAPAAGAAASTSSPVVGVVFCGRQTPGAHTLVCELADALRARAPGARVLGFVGGTRGLLAAGADAGSAAAAHVIELTPAALAPFRHQGGMHLLGRSVDRLRSASERAAVLAAAEALHLTGLLMIGGTFTATDAAHLAEYFATRQLAAGGLRTAVVAVPVTIDGDVKNEFVETTLGHDTATKVYAQLVGNMATDSNSAKKYW